MRDYIFSAYYYHDPTRLVKVKAKTRAKAIKSELKAMLK